MLRTKLIPIFLTGVVTMSLLVAACSSNRETTAPPAAVAAGQEVQQTPQGQQTPKVDPAQIQRDLLSTVNQERAREKLPRLSDDDGLRHSALDHSQLMADARTVRIASKNEPSVFNRIHGGGVEARAVGENVLRLSQKTENIPRAALETWLESPANRRNLLSPEFSRTGIGIVTGSDGELYVTQDFAG